MFFRKKTINCPNCKFELEVICDECNEELKKDSFICCKSCLDKAIELAHSDGYDEGKENAETENEENN